VDASDYTRYRPLMFSIAYRMTGSVSDAEDIVQEAFLKATRAEADSADNPKAYLATITTRLAIDHLRSARSGASPTSAPGSPNHWWATPTTRPAPSRRPGAFARTNKTKCHARPACCVVGETRSRGRIKTMRVFVAGATGVIGQYLVPGLITAGHEVTASTRSPLKASQLKRQGAKVAHDDAA
jgi:Sigma-70 region 2/NmrA-like family